MHEYTWRSGFVVFLIVPVNFMPVNTGRLARYRTTAIFRISIDVAAASPIYLLSMVSRSSGRCALSFDDRKQNTTVNTFRGAIKAIVPPDN